MNNEERKRRILKVIILVFAILSLNNIILTIRNYSYAYFHKNVKSDIKLKITTLDEMPVKSEPLIDTLKSKLNSSNSITDTDGTIYLSGSNDTINFNYVWYSGKLWRITAINSDGSIKLVTQDAITSINWGADAKNYKGSWIYQWLNEDFKETLYNYEEIIVQNADWNKTKDGNSIPVRPPSDEDGIVHGDVGTLNAYEYYQSYKNTSYTDGYLNIGYWWWLITPYSGSYVWAVANNGTLINDFYGNNSPSSNALGVRPSIQLKSNIEIVGSGAGSLENPYRVIGDKELGSSGELINTRLSGEYVKVDNKVYRIVGIENNTTKLTSVDYVRDDSGAVLTKNFGSTASWATSVASRNNNYWGYYLNNTWLTNELENYITDGTYYLGQYPNNSSYKNTICSVNNTTERTSNCEKTSSTWTGLVGLPRVGEMFSAMLGKGYNDTSTYIWLITPYYNSSSARFCSSNGGFGENSPSSGSYGVRPSINLKSEVIISSGSGTKEDPYLVALPE